MPNPFPVCVENVTKVYRSRQHQAICDLTFHISSGQVVGLLGPNGAGKTTTIKLLATVQRPTAGSIRFGPDGVDVWTCGENLRLEYKRSIGWVPEYPAVYDRLTAAEHLLFVGRLIGLKDNVIRKRIDELLPQFDLDPHSTKWLGTYSNGMRRKTALAAALLTDPQILLLDEPTPSLDPQGVRVVKDLIRRYRDEGRSVLLSTHILEIAEELCDRVVVLQKGRALFDGTIKQLQAEASGRFTPSLESLFFELLQARDNAGTDRGK